MQQEEPFSTNGLSALDDYMAALLRDDADPETHDIEDEARLKGEVNESQAEPQEKNSPSPQTKDALPVNESSQSKELASEIAQQSFEAVTRDKPLKDSIADESTLAQIAPEPITPRLPAEAIPADVALSSVQKHSLQKLLDQQMNAPAHEAYNLQVATQTLAADESDEDSLDTVGAELIEDGSLPYEQEGEGADQEQVETAESDELSQATIEFEQEAAQAITQKSHREHWANGLPDWGSQRFDVLLFSCRNVNLAIPLISLGHIYLERGSLTQMPSLPPWVLGVKASAGGNLKVIDAGAYFMPERAATLDADDELHIVSLAGSQWAFAVDTVANPISMNIQDVQWRSQSPQSPWLAGAIKREMCVLIDPPALLFELHRKRSV